MRANIYIYFKTIGWNFMTIGSSVGMTIVQFEDSLCQRLEVKISIWSSYSRKIFYENSIIYRAH
jgi:hypothetical protein